MVTAEITGYSTVIVGNPWKNLFFLKLESDSGVSGIGEASLNGFVRTVSAAVSELEDFFVGQSAFDVNKIVHSMTYSVYSDGGQIHRAAIAACLTNALSPFRPAALSSNTLTTASFSVQ